MGNDFPHAGAPFPPRISRSPFERKCPQRPDDGVCRGAIGRGRDCVVLDAAALPPQTPQTRFRAQWATIRPDSFGAACRLACRIFAAQDGASQAGKNGRVALVSMLRAHSCREDRVTEPGGTTGPPLPELYCSPHGNTARLISLFPRRSHIF